MIKKRCLIFLLITTALIFSKSVKAQVYRVDSIDVNLIQPKKNPFPTRPSIFFIYTRNIPVSNLKTKVNYWKTKLSFGINLNQAAFSDNWSSGGVNSIALGSVLNYKAEYNKKDINLTSEVLLQYGKLKNEGQLERKTNDRMFFDNKAAMKISKNWSFFGSLSFESQFDLGYSYAKDASGNETRKLISKFMAPGYLTESIGFEYKPVKYFSVRLGTGTARQTFLLDTTLYKNNPKNFGVPIGKTFRNELAFQAVANFDKDIMPNLNLKSRYLLFAAYEKLTGIDQRLDVTITAKVNRIINVTVSATGLYDDDFSNKIQYSQGLALGIVFKTR
ncbi:DUF3078 domain-containing protein [Pedobacter sp. SD-b]|uniref:DUF3078 domain-containing protein n=1 Tax=Pedobacter segetis TaxID=2793069 RepID=A0ABS1BEZ2_9SPHI|nr:DUF3078 domain-containing protein [Pedobacter segetis]MBK0381385.1 DUF3078 domain-containing protein [Pedobacter segetis]